MLVPKKITSERELHPPNALLPMLDTELGMVMEIKAVQPENAD